MYADRNTIGERVGLQIPPRLYRCRKDYHFIDRLCQATGYDDERAEALARFAGVWRDGFPFWGLWAFQGTLQNPTIVGKLQTWCEDNGIELRWLTGGKGPMHRDQISPQPAVA